MSRYRALLAPVLLSTGLMSCGGDQETDANQDAPPPLTESAEQSESPDTQGQGLPGFFTPKAGETWTYEVHRDLPPDSILNDDDQLRSSDLPGGGYRFTDRRQRICRGIETPENSTAPLTVIEVTDNGVLTGREYLDIGAEGMLARGWQPSQTIGEAPRLLEPGVLLAAPDMVGGQTWSSTGATANQLFQFRVIERTSLSIPAGTFEAVRIQMNSGSGSKALRRTLWFAEKIGIIKEESVYYDERRIQVRETATLTEWSVPTGPPTEVTDTGSPSITDPSFDPHDVPAPVPAELDVPATADQEDSPALDLDDLTPIMQDGEEDASEQDDASAPATEPEQDS